MAQLDSLLFQHVPPLRAEAVALPDDGGVLFSDEGYERFLQGGRVAPEGPSLFALATHPDWAELRQAWARVLPVEFTSFEGWLANLQTYANLDWSVLDGLADDL